jgi:hypothetical protein
MPYLRKKTSSSIKKKTPIHKEENQKGKKGGTWREREERTNIEVLERLLKILSNNHWLCIRVGYQIIDP